MAGIETKERQAYQILKEAIISGELKPGSRLTISEVVRNLGFSEIPIREAMKSLAAEGYIEFTPYAGAVVTPISLKDFHETAEIRLILEPFGTRLAVAHLSMADFRTLEELVRSMDDAVAVRDVKKFITLDKAFHQMIYDRCPNSRLRQMLMSLRDASERNMIGLTTVPGHLEASQEEHHEMLSALLEHDEEKVEQATRSHRIGVTGRVRELVEAEGRSTTLDEDSGVASATRS